MTPTAPEKRKNFTAKTKGLIRERSGGTCEVHLVPRCMYPALPEACNRVGAEVDHVTPAYANGPATVENGAFLCGLCHKLKTVTDNKEAKKSNRLKGNSQADKRAAAKAEGTHRPIGGSGKMGRQMWRPEGYVSPLNSKSAFYVGRKMR